MVRAMHSSFHTWPMIINCTGTISTSTLYGMELLNEPWGPDEFRWEELRDRFYPQGYDLVRSILADNNVVIQQAFRSPADYEGYMSENEGVVVDYHNYQCFGDYWNGVALEPQGWGLHLDASCAYTEDLRDQTLPAFVGEWSLSVSDCTKYLDGGYKTPYVGPNSDEETCDYYNNDFSTYTDDYKAFMKTFMLAQMDGFENANAGWMFWTAKTEDNCAPEWDYLFLLQNGIAPADLCQRNRFCV